MDRKELLPALGTLVAAVTCATACASHDASRALDERARRLQRLEVAVRDAETRLAALEAGAGNETDASRLAWPSAGRLGGAPPSLQPAVDRWQTPGAEEPGVLLTLPGSVTFAPGSSLVLAPTRDRLAAIGRALAAMPECRILVEGHTDSAGERDFNLVLSQLRAESVKAVFVESGIDALSIDAVGYGATKPVAGNETAEGRRQNRRVEIIVQGVEEPILP